MPVITIISDLGNFSLETAKVHGALLTMIPGSTVVNIHNGLPPWQIAEGIYLMKQTRKSFPPGSVHLFGINLRETRHILASADGHWYLAPDNGALPEILKDENAQYFDLGSSDEPFFLYNFYPQKIKELVDAHFKPDLNNITPQKTLFISPSVSGNRLKAYYTYFDHYGNAHLNLKRKEFTDFIQGGAFKIWLNQSDFISVISENYFSLPDGEMMAVFNSNDYLEIAYVRGNVNRLFGLKNIEYAIIEKL